MTPSCSWKIVAEKALPEQTIQLVEDDTGGYLLRKISVGTGAILYSAAVHGDPIALAEARELFPDLLPFGAVPVDAT